MVRKGSGGFVLRVQLGVHASFFSEFCATVLMGPRKAALASCWVGDTAALAAPENCCTHMLWPTALQPCRW